MRVDVVMPQLGESIAEGTIIKWHKKPGDPVKKDETILEVSTDKVDSEIPAPVSGKLIEIVVPEGETVPVGAVLAAIETEEEAAAAEKPPAPGEEKAAETVTKRAEPAAGPRAAATGARPKGKRFLSPLIRSIARKEGIPLEELEMLPGSGKNGRLRKQDVLAYLEKRKAGTAPSKTAEEHAAVRGQVPQPEAPPVQIPAGLRFERVPMDHIRKSIAKHMVESVRTSAHVTSVHEADVTRMMELIREKGEAFRRQTGAKLTPTAFIIQATARALKEFPVFNASIDGEDIIYYRDVNIGVAVAMENGLIVPVLRNADELSLAGIATRVADLARRARSKKLLPDEVHGGTFSITNYGVFDTLIGTPIINQPQVAILGTGAAKQRPVVIDGMIAVRWMMYLTLTFDHRIADGAIGGRFLQRMTRLLENVEL